VDEVSMVGGKMAADILDVDVKILAVGDPHQLPPVNDVPGFTNEPGNAVLSVIHRQAEGGGICALATSIREGKPVAIGDHGSDVRVVAGWPKGVDELLSFDQVICRTNKTRRRVNNAFRKALGFTEALPTDPRERLICIQNSAEMGLINGQQVRLVNAIADGNSLIADVVPCNDEGVPTGADVAVGADVWTGALMAHKDPDSESAEKAGRGMASLDFAYAVTCHKAQGSEFGTVAVLVEPGGGSTDDQRRWLYTAVTRARLGVTLYMVGAR
jgi:exodeoxyribonuclease V